MAVNPDSLRIHFACVTAGQVTRVAGPLRDLNADVLYLLRSGPEDDHLPARETIREWVGERLLEVREVDTELDDPAFVAHEVGRVVEQRPDNHFRFNLSGGPRETALGGFMSSMFWPVRPYLSHVYDDRMSGRIGEPEYSHTTDVTSVSPQSVDDAVVAGLRLLVEAGGRAKQAELVNGLHAREYIRPKKGQAELSPQAKQGQFQRIAKALAQRNLARKHGHGRGCEWEITDEGRMTYRVFEDPWGG